MQLTTQPPHAVSSTTSTTAARPTRRFGPEVSRILFVRNLPSQISPIDLYKIFGKYGGIRQIRIGTSEKTKRSAFVVYDDMGEAKHAMDALTGFNVEGRFLTLAYFHGRRKDGGASALEDKKNEVAQLKNKYL